MRLRTKSFAMSFAIALLACGPGSVEARHWLRAWDVLDEDTIPADLEIAQDLASS